MQEDYEFRQPINRETDALVQELENFNHTKTNPSHNKSIVKDQPEHAPILPSELYRMPENPVSALETINTYQRG
jgi:hypothetical protein